jgi:hypothetical protein
MLRLTAANNKQILPMRAFTIQESDLPYSELSQYLDM